MCSTQSLRLPCNYSYQTLSCRCKRRTLSDIIRVSCQTFFGRTSVNYIRPEIRVHDRTREFLLSLKFGELVLAYGVSNSNIPEFFFERELDLDTKHQVLFSCRHAESEINLAFARQISHNLAVFAKDAKSSKEMLDQALHRMLKGYKQISDMFISHENVLEPIVVKNAEYQEQAINWNKLEKVLACVPIIPAHRYLSTSSRFLGKDSKKVISLMQQFLLDPEIRSRFLVESTKDTPCIMTNHLGLLCCTAFSAIGALPVSQDGFPAQPLVSPVYYTKTSSKVHVNFSGCFLSETAQTFLMNFPMLVTAESGLGWHDIHPVEPKEK